MKRLFGFILAAAMAFSTVQTSWAASPSFNGLPLIMTVEEANAINEAREAAKAEAEQKEQAKDKDSGTAAVAAETFRNTYVMKNSAKYTSSGFNEGDVIFDDEYIKITAATKLDKDIKTNSNNVNYTDTNGVAYNSTRSALIFEPKKAGKLYVPATPGLSSSGATQHALIFSITDSANNIINVLDVLDADGTAKYTGCLAELQPGTTYYFAARGYNSKTAEVTYTDGEITNEKEAKVWEKDETLTDITGVTRQAPVKATDSLTQKPTLWLLGDSTGAYYDAASEAKNRKVIRNGFGMALGYDSQSDFQPVYGIFDTDKINIRNLAISGISSKDFVSNQWYNTLTSGWKAGDYVLIAFGHNNEKADDANRFTDSSMGAEGWNLKEQYAYSIYKDYILPAVNEGVTPIIVTPIVRRNASSDSLQGSSVHNQGVLGDYRQTVVDLANKFGLSCIDNTYLTYREFIGIGTQAYAAYHATNEKLVDDIDDTHTNADGARMIAYFMSMAIKGQDKDIAYADAKVDPILTDLTVDNDTALASLATFLRSDIEDPRGKEYDDNTGDVIGPDDFAAKLEADSTGVKVNDTFNITAKVSNVPKNGKINRIKLSFAYDSDEVTPDSAKGIMSVSGTELISAADFAKAVEAQTTKTIGGKEYKVVTIEVDYDSAVAEENADFNIPFKLNKYGEVTVRIDNAVIMKGASGDVDGDGIVTSNDAALVIAKPGDAVVAANGDINGDGTVDNTDAADIMKMVLRASNVPAGSAYEGAAFGNFSGHFDKDTAA